MTTTAVAGFKEQVTDKILSIADAAYPAVTPGAAVNVMDGVSGLAILYANLYLHDRNDEHIEKLEQTLNLLLDNISKGISSFSLCSGLAGNALVLHNIKKLGIFEMDIDELLDDCDRYLVKGFYHLIDKGNIDFLHGSLGIAMYLQQRYKFTASKLIPYQDIVERVTAEANQLLLRVKNFSAEKDEVLYVNCGFAHGLLSIITFLSKHIEYGAANTASTIKQLAGLQMRFYSPYVASNSLFPSIVKLSNTVVAEDQYSIPLGWCYGDLIAALALYKAGAATGDQQLVHTAHEIGLKAIARTTEEETKIIDACFCHGSSGMAFLSKKMYALTGDENFKHSYLYWIKRTMTFCNFEGGVSGYKKFSGEAFENNTGILDGAAGPALVLLAYLDPQCNSWEELFMLD